MVCENTQHINDKIYGHCTAEYDGNLTAHSGFIVQGDITHSGSHVGFFNSSPVVKPSVLTSPNSGTVDILYGTAERDIIINLRTRLNELESKLQSLGLLS